jgi:hypothetical protein
MVPLAIKWETAAMSEQHRVDDVGESQMMVQVVVMTCVFVSLWLAIGVAAIRYVG